MMRSILRAFTSSRRGASASSPKSPKLSTLVAGQSTPTIREESLERYRPGGYHPVRIGDTFNSGRYKVVSKLGYGLYATVWLARDTGTGHHVALKILTADSYDGKHDTFELDILKHLQTEARRRPVPADEYGKHVFGSDKILGLLDQFQHDGPNGQHVCMVFKPMGPDLSNYRRLFPGLRIPLSIAKKITKDLLSALVFLHETGRVIHTDIKPQNILVETPAIDDMFQNAPEEVFAQNAPPLDPPNDFYMESEPVTSADEDLADPENISVRLADFGVASWYDRHLTEWIQPEKLRAPEVILGARWDQKVDIWNLGLLIWELVQGQMCFDGQATAQADYSSEAHLAQMIAILGQFPKSLLERSTSAKHFFDAQGNFLGDVSFPSQPLARMNSNIGFVVGKDEEDFVALINSMLALDPRERQEARDLLQAPWLQDIPS